jgi:hypothetical protein
LFLCPVEFCNVTMCSTSCCAAHAPKAFMPSVADSTTIARCAHAHGERDAGSVVTRRRRDQEAGQLTHNPQ